MCSGFEFGLVPYVGWVCYVMLPSKKPTFPDFNLIRIKDPHENQLEGWWLPLILLNNNLLVEPQVHNLWASFFTKKLSKMTSLHFLQIHINNIIFMAKTVESWFHKPSFSQTSQSLWQTKSHFPCSVKCCNFSNYLIFQTAWRFP